MSPFMQKREGMYELRDNGYSILERFFKQKAGNRMNESLFGRNMFKL